MKFRSQWDQYEQQWIAGEAVDEYGVEAMGYFQTQAEAEAMVRGLESVAEDTSPVKTRAVIDSSAAIHSNVGTAELQVRFDGGSVRITVEHDGDSEVVLTRSGFDRALSMLQAMAQLHFG